MKTVKVIIRNVDGSSMNAGCLLELSRAGIKEGDIVTGQQEDGKTTVWIGDCVAYIGATCELVESIDELPVQKDESIKLTYSILGTKADALRIVDDIYSEMGMLPISIAANGKNYFTPTENEIKKILKQVD